MKRGGREGEQEKDTRELDRKEEGDREKGR